MKTDSFQHTATHGPAQPVQAAIGEHGVIGDQRTAALVTRDGAIDWWCLPAFDGAPVFAHLIDPQQGGLWRLGPATASAGVQRYLEHSAVLSTRWSEGDGELELTDAMLWPARESGADDGRRVLLRRLSCTHGRVSCVHQLAPGSLEASQPLVVVHAGAVAPGADAHWAGLWCSDPRLQPQPVDARFELAAGESVWVALAYREPADAWDLPRAQAALQHTLQAWAHWADRHPYLGAQRHAAAASVRAIRLLGYGPAGSQVAAPTTSLPERIGGSRNYDYRYAWVRDSSLGLAILAVLGDLPSAERYMDWLADRDSGTEMPLQVLYGIDGRCEAPEHEVQGAAGYRDSRPVRVGNHAAQQFQLDSLGYLADCAEIYLTQGGGWKPAYTDLLERITEFTAANWQRQDYGIWELDTPAHYVSSKAMAWVVLDRACKIHKRLRRPVPAHWSGAAQAIHAELMHRGWCKARGAFRQHYETDELDASTLLIGTMGVLPDDHERVVANIAAIQRELTQDGFVWRFHPRSLGEGDERLDQQESAFLPCTFWMASALARLGRTDEARALLQKVEDAFAPLHLFSEEYDPHLRQALGNYPLLFSHAEHLKALMDLSKAEPLAMAGMMAGKLGGKLVRALTPD